MNAAEAVKRCNDNTIGVVPTMGVTFTGHYEPVQEVSDALDKLQKETGLDIPIHVDGASGGFLAPFTCPEMLWDFRLPRVKSINTSGHKFGLAPLGVGWIVWRDKSDLPEKLIFNVNYLGGNMPTFALNFSRPGGQIVAQYYNFLRLGKEGYRKIHQAGYDTAMYLAAAISKMGPFEMLYNGDPRQGIPAVSWKLKEGIDHGFTLFDLADRLRSARLAGPRLHDAGPTPGHGRAADSRQARPQPRLGQPALVRLRGRCCPLRQTSGDDSAVGAGGRQLQALDHWLRAAVTLTAATLGG